MKEVTLYSTMFKDGRTDNHCCDEFRDLLKSLGLPEDLNEITIKYDTVENDSGQEIG